MKVVRVISIEYDTPRGSREKVFATGFVANDGIIVTSAHLFPSGESTVKVRKLDEERFVSVKRKVFFRRIDIALIELHNPTNAVSKEYCLFPNNKSLSAGQTVLSIGNYSLYAGSVVIGRISFPCPDDLPLPCGLPILCEDKTENDVFKRFTQYRVMGDFWNCSRNREMTFQKTLHTELPVIHITGFPSAGVCNFDPLKVAEEARSSGDYYYHFDGDSAGAPIFNISGEIVGMVLMPDGPAIVAIHFMMIEKVISVYKSNIGAKRVGGSKRPSSEAGVRAHRSGPEWSPPPRHLRSRDRYGLATNSDIYRDAYALIKKNSSPRE
ncbi:hypothetical protein BC332_05792 [Capsicum chinense]|nr:hypothetical protein BC332_05792 [Capsicum chinense]